MTEDRDERPQSAPQREAAYGRGRGRAGSCPGRGRGGVGRGALVEPAALAALLRRGAHGYDLRRSISELTQGEIEVDVGGLYRVLRRLEDEGFLVSRTRDGEGGPQRREYELTQEGRKLAEDWIGQLEERRRLASLLVDALKAPTETGGSGEEA